jgi:hypothetical protein
MRKAFGQSESMSLVKKLAKFVEDTFPSVSNALSKLGLLTRSLKQTEQMSQHTDAELSSEMKRYLWTHAHSLYATMGGFVIDTRDLGFDYSWHWRKRMTLTLKGLEFIAKHDPDLLPDLSAPEIMDKSKASIFTKMITIIQALWFCIQCITRSTHGLSVSLLEMNTAIHAVCALALYFFFWWEKPLDVEEPTICTHKVLHHIAAFPSVRISYPDVDFSLADLKNTDDNGILDSSTGPETAVFYPAVLNILLRPSKDPELQSKNCLVYHGFVFRQDMSLSSHGPEYGQMTQFDFERFKLASQAAKRYNLDFSDAGLFFAVRLKRTFEGLFVKVEDSQEKIYFMVGVFLAGLFYGGVHLVVWNRPFRGEMDELLWKLSSITILVSPVLGAILSYWGRINVADDDGNYYPPMCMEKWYLVWQISFVFHLVFCLLSICLYGCARIFIIVQCFLDVSYLPDSAFEVPRWSQYFPHIG